MRSGYCDGIEQIVKVARFTGCNKFVGKIKKFIFNAFVDFKGYVFVNTFCSSPVKSLVTTNDIP